MSMTTKNITGLAVLAISTVGQNGTCWINQDNIGAENYADVRIYHSAAGAPSIETVIEQGRKLFIPNKNNDEMIISADSALDVYYAVCKNEDDKATIIVDVV